MVISGCIGPRGDGYNPSSLMSVDEAERYHNEQIKVFANTEADMVTAITMNYSDEAEGVVRAKTSEHACCCFIYCRNKWVVANWSVLGGCDYDFG